MGTLRSGPPLGKCRRAWSWGPSAVGGQEAAHELVHGGAALATLADGESYIHEAIYDGRFALADELTKMGAKIEVDGTRAIVHGPTVLHGTEVIAHDLRSGAAAILAGLVAEGETIVAPAYPVDRGHSQFATRLSALGADVVREELD